MSLLQLAINAPDTVHVVAGAGLIDTATEKITNIGTLCKLGSSVAGMGFVIYQAISSRFALARVLIAGLTAGVLVWIVFHVTNLQNKVDNEVALPSSHTVVQVHSGHPAAYLGVLKWSARLTTVDLVTDHPYRSL